MNRTKAIREAKDGKERGFRWLFEEDRVALFSFIRKKGLPSQEAEDVLQNVFTRAFAHLGQLEDPRRYTAWIFRIARNEIVRHHSRSAGSQSLEELEIECERETRLAEALERERLMEVVRTLADEIEPAEIRETARRYYFGAPRTSADLAEELGLPPATVRKRLSLFRHRLRDRVAASLLEDD